MNLKMFAQFVMVAGLAVFGYGGYQYHEAEAEAEQATKQAGQQMGFFGAVIVGMDAEANQQGKQQDAKKLLAIGGAVIFLGIALSASCKDEGARKEAKGAKASEEARTWDV